MAIDIEQLKNEYFIFNKPVPYKLKCGLTIEIKPVKLIDSMVFASSCGILDIDKNKSTDVNIIQMSYLKFLGTTILLIPQTQQQLVNICLLCLGFNHPYIFYDEKQRAILLDINDQGEPIVSITAKEFDEIKRIILYQNLPKYEDDYIDPELKKAMQEQDELKAKDISIPTLERRISIITSHTGILKKDQMEMTLREHSLLFEEVVGEVEYSAVKGISCLGEKSADIQWIYKKEKGKFDEYITSVEKYNKSMGGDGRVKTTNNSEDFTSQMNEFIGGK